MGRYTLNPRARKLSDSYRPGATGRNYTLSVENSIVKQIDVNLIQATLREHFSDARESREMRLPRMTFPDIAVGLSKWLKGRNIIADHHIYSGETWPMQPGRWETTEILGKAYLLPVNTLIIFEDYALSIDESDYDETIVIEVHAPIGEAQKILDSIRAAIKKHGVMKGGVISGGQLLERSTLGLSNFFVNKDILEEIRIHLLDLFDEKKQRAFKAADVPFQRGVLLTGIPGTGKTTLSKIIEAVSPNITVMWLQQSQLDDSFGACMELARKLSPTIVVMEDLDTVATDRKSTMGNRPLGRILNEINGRAVNDGIVFIGTTNRPDDLDPALTRSGRFDIIIELGLPDDETRLAFIKHLFRDLPLPSKIKPDQLLSATKGYTQADIVEMVRSAVLSVLHEDGNEIHKRHFRKISKDKKRLGFTS